MTAKFVTTAQKKHLAAALKMTNSEGFMHDAISIAAYRPGGEGDPEHIVAIAVFECFRGDQAEMHFAMANGRIPSREIIQGLMTVAFHPKMLNLRRVLTRTPARLPNAIAGLLKVGFQIEFRHRNCLADGGDAIVSSLDRAAVLNMASAEPQTI